MFLKNKYNPVVMAANTMPVSKRIKREGVGFMFCVAKCKGVAIKKWGAGAARCVAAGKIRRRAGLASAIGV